MKTIITIIFLLLAIVSNQALAQKSIGVLGKECAKNNYESCDDMGLNYEYGIGVRQDKNKAIQLYTKACNGGIANGCNNLGAMYSNGEGVRQDKSKALQLFGKACDMKNEGGCKNYVILKNQGIQ